MPALWQLPIAVTRGALALPGRAVRLAGDVVGVVSDLGTSAERIRRLLDDVEDLPPRVAAVVGDVEGLLGQLDPLPPRIDGLLTGIEHVPPRLDGLLGSIEPLPPRLDELLSEIATVVPQVQALLGTVAEVVDGVRPVLTSATRHTQAAGAAIGQVQGLLDDGQQLRDTVAQLDPAVLDGLVTVLGHAETVLASTVELELVDRVEAEVLPAVSSLEGLVPVVARLSVVVDHLNEQVVEVGALLGGIPGASRLLKRGDARKAVDHR